MKDIMIYSYRLLILLGIFSLIHLDLNALADPSQGDDGFEGIIRFQIKSSMADMNTGLLPAFTEYHIKGDDIVIQMIGADNLKMARILIKGNQRTFYMIDDDARTAMKVKVSDGEEEDRIGNVPDEYREEYEKALKEADKNLDSEKIDLIETGETLIIQGYKCKKYIVTAEAGEALVKSEVWLTDKIQVSVPEVLKDKKNPLLLFMNENGFPLRFTGKSNSDGQSFNFEMVAVKVSPGYLDPVNFEIPADYHISDMTSFLERE
jgi:hypothetical protein